MIKLRISVFNEVLEQGKDFLAPHGDHAIWIKSGTIKVGEESFQESCGTYVGSESLIACSVAEPTQIIRFTVTTDDGKEPLQPRGNLLLSNTFSIENVNSILRLDRVTFPENAVAYRHIHPGAGIRYLTRGMLQIIADDHSKQIKPNEAWFEDANSPVKAIAAPAGISEFIRVMVLPAEYLGKPTIKRLNEEDMDKPTLQTNHRYFDEGITLR